MVEQVYSGYVLQHAHLSLDQGGPTHLLHPGCLGAHDRLERVRLRSKEGRGGEPCVNSEWSSISTAASAAGAALSSARSIIRCRPGRGGSVSRPWGRRSTWSPQENIPTCRKCFCRCRASTATMPPASRSVP